MFARRSLGDSPLEHESNEIGLLDFIGRNSDESVLSPSPVTLKVRNTEIVQNEQKPDKITVSYYLEEHLVKRVRALATLTERSYSSLAAEALKMLLRKYGF